MNEIYPVIQEIQKTEENQEKYLSTRECAKKLQISLGTVQKMVETGELVAWKTRGGHRRILLSSLDQLLNRRQARIRNLGASHCLLLGIFKREENKTPFINMISQWSTKVNLKTFTDSLDGLMAAVEFSPDLIYIDALISPVEQIHLLHYLSRHSSTNRIPILLDEGFMATQPGAIRMAAENSGILKPQSRAPLIDQLEDLQSIHHPLLYPYPGTTEPQNQISPGKDLEHLVIKALGDRFTLTLNNY